jgi:hypothetical protein
MAVYRSIAADTLTKLQVHAPERRQRICGARRRPIMALSWEVHAIHAFVSL